MIGRPVPRIARDGSCAPTDRPHLHTVLKTMTGVSFPVTRPVGRALVVGNAACRADVLRLLEPQGYSCTDAEEPYAAMRLLCRERLSIQALILCLGSLYREELGLISTVKSRFGHVEIWLAQTDGRMAALAEGVRLGADGLLAEDGSLHRMAAPGVTAPSSSSSLSASARYASGTEISGDNTARNESPTTDPSGGAPPDLTTGEPVLSADELRALLQDQPSLPPSGTAE
jgi:hypothetical protein